MLTYTLVAFIFSCETPISGGEGEKQMSLHNQLLAMVQALASNRPFRIENVSQLTGSTLHLVPTESNDFFLVYRSEASSGTLLTEVELRQPTPQTSAKDGLILLTIAPSLCISQEVIMARFGMKPQLEVPTPQQPEDAPMYLIYPMEWGELRFGFQRQAPEYLTGIVLDATGR
jgi:hypothetical protein